MGYTHYMKGVNLTDELLENTKSIVKIAEKKGIHLTSDEDKKPPVLNENLIVINGYRDKACETFLVMSENQLKKESEEWASSLFPPKKIKDHLSLYFWQILLSFFCLYAYCAVHINSAINHEWYNMCAVRKRNQKRKKGKKEKI